MDTGSWRAEWETLSYEADVGEVAGDQYRARARIEHGRVVRYTVQYEARIDGTTYPVVRYDSAHGQPHRDTLDRAGRVVGWSERRG